MVLQEKVDLLAKCSVIEDETSHNGPAHVQSPEAFGRHLFMKQSVL
jgi:hypothetical protein